MSPQDAEQKRKARATIGIVSMTSFFEAILGVVCIVSPETAQKVLPDIQEKEWTIIGWILLVLGVSSLMIFQFMTRNMDRK